MIRRLCLALGLAATATTAFAGARERLDAFTTQLKGLDGRFVQRVFDGNGQLTEETSGRVALAQPRQFRWEYQQPFPQLIVADGDHIWVYDPDLEQVTVRNQSYEEQTSPLSALIDPGELDRQFQVEDGGREGDTEWLLLKPRKPDAAQFKQARLGFGAQGLTRMVIEDSFGQKSEVAFSDWRRDPKFDPDTFKFTPPPGVDVVGEVEEGADVYPIQD